MTGGSLNLASAKGMAEDVINLNPQITFFKKVYKRHTNFSIQDIEQRFPGPVSLGGKYQCTINRFGDLLGNCYIRNNLLNKFYYKEFIFLHLI